MLEASRVSHFLVNVTRYLIQGTQRSKGFAGLVSQTSQFMSGFQVSRQKGMGSTPAYLTSWSAGSRELAGSQGIFLKASTPGPLTPPPPDTATASHLLKASIRDHVSNA